MTYNPRQYASAGDALTEGVPAESYGAGSFQFQTNIMVLGTEPSPDLGAFRAQLTGALAHYLPTSSNVRDASVIKGARQPINVFTNVPLAVVTAVTAVSTLAPRLYEAGATVGGVVGGLIGGPPGAALGVIVGGVVGAGAALSVAAVGGHTTGTESIPSWWLSVSGKFTVADNWQLIELNRGIAEAIIASTRFTGMNAHYTGQLPVGAVSLVATLSTDGNCAGGIYDGQVFARACTRVAPTAAPVVVTAPIPATPTTPAYQGQLTPLGGPIVNPRLCKLSIGTSFRLRPTATTSDVGPMFPAGLMVDVLEPTQLGDATSRLFRVRVATRGAPQGYVLLSNASLAACPGLLASLPPLVTGMEWWKKAIVAGSVGGAIYTAWRISR